LFCPDIKESYTYPSKKYLETFRKPSRGANDNKEVKGENKGKNKG
jgi:hypothetical protein